MHLRVCLSTSAKTKAGKQLFCADDNDVNAELEPTLSFLINVVTGEGDDDNCENDDGLDVYEAGVSVLKKARKK